jgi:hypothetical protein
LRPLDHVHPFKCVVKIIKADVEMTLGVQLCDERTDR